MPSRRNALYILAIFSLLTGLFTGRADLFIIAYLIAALLILSLLWTWLSLRGIALRRTTRTRRSQVGRVFQESFGVRKTGILPKLWLEIRDHLNPARSPRQPRRAHPSPQSRIHLGCRDRLRPPRRIPIGGR